MAKRKTITMWRIVDRVNGNWAIETAGRLFNSFRGADKVIDELALMDCVAQAIKVEIPAWED